MSGREEEWTVSGERKKRGPRDALSIKGVDPYVIGGSGIKYQHDQCNKENVSIM